MKSLQEYVEHRFQQWKPAGHQCNDAVEVAKAMTELAADGVTTVGQLEGFDLEGVWER